MQVPRIFSKTLSFSAHLSMIFKRARSLFILDTLFTTFFEPILSVEEGLSDFLLIAKSSTSFTHAGVVSASVDVVDGVCWVNGVAAANCVHRVRAGFAAGFDLKSFRMCCCSAVLTKFKSNSFNEVRRDWSRRVFLVQPWQIHSAFCHI